MRKSVLTYVALTVAVFSIPALAMPTQPNARGEIQQVLHQSDESLHRKDIQGCMACLTQNFEGRDIHGNRFDRAVAKQSLTKSLSYTQSATAHTLIVRFAIAKGKAVVVSQEHTTLSIVGKRTHRLHSLVFDGLWRSVWINTKSGWREEGEKQLTSTITRDGIRRVVSPTKNLFQNVRLKIGCP